MKMLIALFTVLTLNISYAEQGDLALSFTPTSSSSENKSTQSIGLYLANECYEDVYVVTRTRNYNGYWETKGYFRISPGYRVYDTTMSRNYFYLHARTYDGHIRWDGPYNIPFNGYNLKARLIELPGGANGNWTIRLICY